MGQLLAPPALETALVSYLGARMPGVHVGTKVPNPAPSAFVRVNRYGGARTNLIQTSPMVLFEAWAPGEAAEQLACGMWALVNDLNQSWVAPGVWCNGIPSLSDPVNLPDNVYETRDHYQFYAVLLISLRRIPD